MIYHTLQRGTYLFLAVICGMAMNIAPAVAQEKFLEDEAFVNAVKQIIMENPEVILESLEKDRIAKRAAEEKETEEKIKAYLPELTAKSQPSAGPADASVTVVEFFDYNCGYCKRAYQDIKKILETDKDVRVVFIEMPILAQSSKDMAELALLANLQNPDKYFEVHSALMDHKGSKSRSELEKVVEKAGIDLSGVKDKKDVVAAQISENMKITRDVGINGTPAFLLNGKLMRGYVGYDALKAMIDQARKE